uniref:Putative secreted protein n=1 Tax=Anopheles darlingi TaxID=43151 RepID=A0A2M4DJE9_ANODA
MKSLFFCTTFTTLLEGRTLSCTTTACRTDVPDFTQCALRSILASIPNLARPRVCCEKSNSRQLHSKRPLHRTSK